MAEPRITNPREFDFAADFEAARQRQLAEAQERIMTAMNIPERWMFTRGDRMRFWGEEAVEAPPPPDATGGIMISFLPEKEEIDKTELTHVRSWIADVTAGGKKTWPGFPLTLRINGKGRYVTAGYWECPNGDSRMYVGNSTAGGPTPIWAPSALMAIARYYHLDDEADTVKRIHEMLATIIAKEIIPVMTDLATGYNGSPITEIAVNKKERIFVGRYPDVKGDPGPFRHLTGEVAEINDKDWVILKM